MSFWDTATTGIKWCTLGLVDATCLSGGLRTASVACSFVPYPWSIAFCAPLEGAAWASAVFIEGKDPKVESAIGAAGLALSLVPLGTAAKGVMAMAKGAEQTAIKGVFAIAREEGVKVAAKEIGKRMAENAVKTAAAKTVDGLAKHAGRQMAGWSVYLYEEAADYMGGVENLQKCDTDFARDEHGKPIITESGKKLIEFRDNQTGKICHVEVSANLPEWLVEKTALLELRSQVSTEIQNSGPINRTLDMLKDGGTLGVGAAATVAYVACSKMPMVSGYSSLIAIAVIGAGIYAAYCHEDKFKRGFGEIADKQAAEKELKGQEKAKGRDAIVNNVQREHIFKIDSTEIGSKDVADNTVKPNRIAAKDKSLQHAF